MMAVDRGEVRAWTIRDSSELYNVEAWGDGYFSINEHGNIDVTPQGPEGVKLDLRHLLEDLKRRGVRIPVVIRFSEILEDRVKKISTAFNLALQKFSYQNIYRGVYPIKVNQERLIVEELVRYGRKSGLGLEAGSKPELLVALAYQNNPDAFIIGNGYKDEEYIRLALLAQELGRKVILVIDRFAEVRTILKVAKQLKVSPILGVRAHLNVKGAGKWAESTGDRSKFGLTSSELVNLVAVLKDSEMLSCLQLLHFHIGSQITAVRAIKTAMAESCRILVELYKLGAPMRYLDVGGGLAVDYDGSQTNFPSSSNYTLQEYADDVVSSIADICHSAHVPHPLILSESGRALTAHHSVLIFDVLGVRQQPTAPKAKIDDASHRVLYDLNTACQNVSRKNFQEIYHDILQLRDEAKTLFRVGVFDLEMKALAERLFWHTCTKIQKLISSGMTYVPDDLDGLKKTLADIYYCNFSVFQSVPDHWACKQLFPTLPIHRLNEKPKRWGTLADLTCDSDGQVDQFIDLRDVKDVLELHELKPDEPYYLGMFLVGAYQEILGDLHNLFGDTHCIHVRVNDNGRGYHVEDLEEGETITDVLNYVSYDRKQLLNAIRIAAEQAVNDEKLSFEKMAVLLREYESSMNSYTYLGD